MKPTFGKAFFKDIVDFFRTHGSPTPTRESYLSKTAVDGYIVAFNDKEARSEADRVVDEIVAIYEALKARGGDLRPCDEVNAKFTSLVSICATLYTSSTTRDIMSHPRLLVIINDIRAICSKGEFEMEVWWSNKIIQECGGEEHGCGIIDATPHLQTFPYYNNYTNLTTLELSAIHSVLPPSTTHTFAFIGSGPLPLTPICLSLLLPQYDNHTYEIHNIDISQTAIETSTHLAKLLPSLPTRMTFQHANAATDAVDLTRFDVVYLAALVGLNAEEKRSVVERVAKGMRKGACVVVRSAWGVRGVLYPVSLNFWGGVLW
ncbi:putative 26S proteasome regulatory subunit [Borealophlyctis nickersoniae]|nr:putative 26S proteasome regulatory subunit [Borealophlyctis nickersoniae]